LVNSLLPNREQAIGLLHKNNCPPQVIRHCLSVADLAIETARELLAKGLKVDVELVEAGAILHDLGRSKNHTVGHGVVGAQMAQSLGLPQPLVNIIKRHVGGGISAEEAAVFGWPKDSYMPQTLEEKIVCYADKLIDKSRRVSIEIEIGRLQKENKIEAADRIRKLNIEITDLLGNSHDHLNVTN
jgi:uncharacterized protein